MKDRDRPWVLGIGSSHNGAACLLRGDEIVVAVQEERLVRQKRANLPASCASLAVEYCFDYAGIGPSDLSAIGVCTRAGGGPFDDVSLNPRLRIAANRTPVLTICHHLGHAVAALATSGFDSASVLVIDGTGSPWPTLSDEERAAVVAAQHRRHAAEDESVCEVVSFYSASNFELRPIEKHVALRQRDTPRVGMAPFFSIGRLFEHVGAQIFGSRLEGPGKVMGLAPYGRPTIPIDAFFDIVDDEIVFRPDVPNRFRHNDRWPQREQEYADLAASAQLAFEHALLWFARRLRARGTSTRLCYAGGVALNSVANERLVREAGFDGVYIMPAAEDSGTAIGAAYNALWRLTPTRRGRRLVHDNIGRAYSRAEVDAAVCRHPVLRVQRHHSVFERTAELLAAGSIVAWFQGGSELGPRALGQRSILADPRRADMKDKLNARVKFREGFRPYAPAVLAEHVDEWFDCGGLMDSPFMLRVLPLRESRRGCIPAVVHVDGTGRVQTVSARNAPRFHALLTAFHERTGVPVLLNTSLNTAGEPIVETPDEALWTLQFTALDACVVEDDIVIKPPDWESPLHLIPQLAPVWIANEHRVRAGRLRAIRPRSQRGIVSSASEGQALLFGDRADAHGDDYVRITVKGRYGRVVHAGGPEILPVLRAIDGRRTGWDLLDRLNRRAPGYGEAALLGLLRQLASRGIVTLLDPRRSSRNVRHKQREYASG